MSRRDNLPNSLELLLDTMCNTFGGIVFIAIALVIITQVAQKMLTATVELRGTPEARQMLREQNAQLEEEIAKLRAELQEKALAAARCSAEKRAKIEALLQARIDLQVAQRKLQALAAEFAELQQRQAETEQELQELQEQLQVAEEQLRELQEKQKLAQQTLDELKRQAEKLKKENRALEQEIEDAQEVFTITFSLEGSTPSYLKQKVALIRNGRVFLDDVNFSWRKDSFGKMTPLFSGNGYQTTPNELSRAMGRLSQSQYFVEIWADGRSFDAVVAFRQWLREQQYRAAWHFTDDFTFYTSDSERNTSF